MRWIAPAVLYLATVLGANADTAPLPQADLAVLEEMRDGQMMKLRFHETPRSVSQNPFLRVDGTEGSLAEYQGRIVVLNFWATWCAPCRKEMPGHDRLNQAFAAEDLAVVTLATGRNSPAGIARFFADTGLETLPQYQDIRQGIAREMEVPGLPTTVILDRSGAEIARMVGEAEWDSPSALGILGAVVALEPAS